MAETYTDSKHPSDVEHHGSGSYYLVWAALLILTALTWFTGRMHLPNFGLVLAMIIATTKATLVVLFFMHLWEQKGVNRITFTATIGFVILIFLGVFGDITTRLNSALPRREDPAMLGEVPKHADAAMPSTEQHANIKFE